MIPVTLQATFDTSRLTDKRFLMLTNDLTTEGYVVLDIARQPAHLRIRFDVSPPSARSCLTSDRRTKLAAERLWALILRYTGLSATIDAVPSTNLAPANDTVCT